MSAPLSKELRQKYKIRSLPIRKDDEVKVARGTHKGQEGKVTTVYRRKFLVYIDKLKRNKANGNTVDIGFPASNLVITKLKLDNDRNALIARKAQKTTSKAGKVAESEVKKD